MHFRYAFWGACMCILVYRAEAGGELIIVGVSDGKLLHRLQVQLKNNRSMGCRRRRGPVG